VIVPAIRGGATVIDNVFDEDDDEDAATEDTSTTEEENPGNAAALVTGSRNPFPAFETSH
jgi:hypothetical protein